MTTTFLGDTVVIERAGERTTIPLRVIRTVRAAEGRSRTVEITLADDAVHSVEANNTTAATAFVAAVAAVLPTRPDGRGSVLVRTEPSAAGPPLFASRRNLVLFVTAVLGYLAYVTYLGVAHGAPAVIGAVIGLLPLGLAALAAVQTVTRLYDKTVLRRRGVIVLARSTGRLGKRSVYAFTDAGGNAHQYRSGLHADTLEIAYDPANPKRMASMTPLVLEVPRVIVLVLFTALFGAVGVGAVFGSVLP
ncbi:hypothetical protein ABZ353_07450 [Streptomyces niveus]|uniref:hypothetical protein n=1 Tax=Streptomyces niveus TaxID=193462 RepID=UPI00340F374C